MNTRLPKSHVRSIYNVLTMVGSNECLIVESVRILGVLDCDGAGHFALLLYLPGIELPPVFGDGYLTLVVGILFDDFAALFSGELAIEELEDVVVDEVVFEDCCEQFACHLMDILGSILVELVLLKDHALVVL